MLPLALGVGASSDTETGGPRAPIKTKAEKILERDDYSCRFCGFRCVKYQRVIPYGGEQITSCVFCEQAVYLERAGMLGSGVLIWLPELTQAELNHVARAMYVALTDQDGPLYESAKRTQEALASRRMEAKKRLGSDDPLLLSAVLNENLKGKQRAEAVKKLEGIRLLPLDKHIVRGRSGDVNGFPQIIDFWRSERGPFGGALPSAWSALFDKATTSAA